MIHGKRILAATALVGTLMLAPIVAQADHHTTKLSGTRFEMQVPKDWAPGYKDLDNLLMLHFSNGDGVVLEGVYLRKDQAADYSLDAFKKARIEGQNKVYSGKDHKVAKEEPLTIGGKPGNYILTTWKEGDKAFEKHTAQYLKDGRQYMVVLWGPTGKVHKKVFDDAVASFSVAK